MRVETIPLVLGSLVALLGVGVIADAWLPEKVLYYSERRRRARAERDLGGETSIGLGVLCMAAALIGRDTWRYGTVAVLAGTVLLFLGAWLNRAYLRERISNRGELRREAPKEPGGRPRIR
ncbi:MAG: hypothetical protein ACJ79A_17170 [Gemmatimonadaceae bacterium]